jgi:hypothetical protein
MRNRGLLHKRLTLVAVLLALATTGVLAGSADAANVSWQPAPVYNTTNMNGNFAFIGFITPYEGVTVSCWTTGSPYSNYNSTTSKWFHVSYFSVYHWLSGYTPAK